MQQYPVPQFTEMEDHIIGRFTIKQFGIIFAAGSIVFAIFSATKNLPITIIFGLFLGLPAVFVALFPFNGRPLYNILPVFIKYAFGPKLFMFRKQASSAIKSVSNLDEKKSEDAPHVSKETATSRLKELNYLLEQKAHEEEELFKPKETVNASK